MTSTPFREACRQLVAAVENRDVEATTTVEVIQEFAHAGPAPDPH